MVQVVISESTQCQLAEDIGTMADVASYRDIDIAVMCARSMCAAVGIPVEAIYPFISAELKSEF